MVGSDAIEKRIYEIIKPYHGRSCKMFKIEPLSHNTVLNHGKGVNMAPLDAETLLTSIFDEFHINSEELKFSIYYPENRKDEISMLIQSAKAGRWLYGAMRHAGTTSPTGKAVPD